MKTRWYRIAEGFVVGLDSEGIAVAANVVTYLAAVMKALENGRFAEAVHVLGLIGDYSSRGDALCLCSREDFAEARASSNLRVIEDRQSLQRASYDHGKEEEEGELHRGVCSKKTLCDVLES
jgi:hypothetical protein